MTIDYIPGTTSNLVGDPAEGGAFSSGNKGEIAGANTAAANASTSATAAAASATAAAHSASDLSAAEANAALQLPVLLLQLPLLLLTGHLHKVSLVLLLLYTITLMIDT